MNNFDHGAITLLLVMLLGASLSTGVLFAWLIRRWLRERRAQAGSVVRPEALPPMGRRQWIACPSRWLAVRGGCPRSVSQALGLDAAVPCLVREGLDRRADLEIFITPPVDGWVLVLGNALPAPADDIDRLYHFIRELGQRFPHVHYYQADRVLLHHAWIRHDNGRFRRAYAWAGETLWQQGPRSYAETRLGLHSLDYHTEPEGDGIGLPGFLMRNVERIPALAGRWSVNPAHLDTLSIQEETGLAGHSPHAPG